MAPLPFLLTLLSLSAHAGAYDGTLGRVNALEKELEGQILDPPSILGEPQTSLRISEWARGSGPRAVQGGDAPVHQASGGLDGNSEHGAPVYQDPVPSGDSDGSSGHRKHQEPMSSFPAPQNQEDPPLRAAASPPSTALPTRAGSVAICLAGGLRMLELTALSLVQHLFGSYPGADVFVMAPLTEDSHKLLLLTAAQAVLSAGEAANSSSSQGAWSLKGVHFLAQEPLEESRAVRESLLASSSPNGVQGLLQYFQLVEGCSPLIAAQEQQQGFKYDWVVRARPDSYWVGPSPALATLRPDAYSYPQGCRYRGLNDRFGIGKRSAAEAGFMRLSVLGDLAKMTPKVRRTSEQCLKSQLQHLRIPFQALPLPFCTVSLRPYAPLHYSPYYVPVFALSNTAPVSGAKCKPCTPVLTGQAVTAALKPLRADFSLPYDPPPPASEGFHLCDSSLPWGSGWEPLFDQQTGPQAATVRKLWAGLSFSECALKLRRVLAPVPSYTGPGAEILCSMRGLGPVLKELYNVNTTLASAKAAFSKVVGARMAQPSLHTAPLDTGSWDALQLPVLSNEGRQNCEACPALIQLSLSTGDVSGKQSLVAEVRRQGWELLKCGGHHTAQICLFLLLKNCDA